VLIRRFQTNDVHSRHGWLAPILALVLFVVLGLVALVLDRLWLDMATTEAQTVAETAALAAARELAHDDLLRSADPENRILQAKIAAESVAALNRVAGEPFTLNADLGEVQFGSNVIVDETGEKRFVESIYQARSVRVSALRTHAKRNPVALFFGGLTRVPAGEVAAFAEATIDNHVIGMQVIGDSRIPALPIAILAKAPAGLGVATWESQIERRQGLDQYRYDSITKSVVAERDGIPEIILHGAIDGAQRTDSNMRLVCVHQGRDPSPFPDQIRLGWSAAHLGHRDGRVEFSTGPQMFYAAHSMAQSSLEALQQVVGESRAVLLFHEEWPDTSEGWGKIQSGGFVAGRVMAVIQQPGKIPQIVFQPTTLATRSAMLMTDIDDSNGATDESDAENGSTTTGSSSRVQVPENKYIYQLKLTQ